MSTWKLAVAALLMAGLVTFIVQNREILELQFLFWTFETRRAYMVLVIFASGVVTGWIVATVAQLAARSREDEARRSAAS